MTPQSPSSKAARLLAEEAETGAPPSGAASDKAVEVATRALRARAVRARRRPIFVGLAAAAAACALVAGGVARWSHGGPPPVAMIATPTAPLPDAASVENVEGGVLVFRGGITHRPERGSAVRTGDRVVVLQDGHATLALPTGTRLELERGGELELLGQGSAQVYHLAAGAVGARVAKLGAGERFIVRTSDAEVEVRGTVFRVSNAPTDPACGDGTTTRVEVLEGRVAVRARAAEVSVGAGERWPACAAPIGSMSAAPVPIGTPAPRLPRPSAANVSPPSVPPAVALAPESTLPKPKASDGTSHPVGYVEAPPASPERGLHLAERASELAAQNDLLEGAIAAKRRGDLAAALSANEQFLTKYPSSTLAESAYAERMRLLMTIDPSRGRQAAREYLARFPSGFARSEASGFIERGKAPGERLR